MVKSFLQLTRAHTAPLEIVPALLGAALAEGTIWSGSVLAWGFFGLLYHLSGYGMNSYLDWEKGYDRLDRNKQHHPLNRGSMSPFRARLIVGGLFLLVGALGVGLSWGNIPAIISLILGASFGVAYNVFGKSTDYKFVFISIAHTSVFITPFIALGGDIFSYSFRLAAVYVFLWVAYQISVSGEIKDIQETEESNLLRDKIGISVRKKYGMPPEYDSLRFSDNAILYAQSLKGLNLVIGGMIFLWLTGDPLEFTLLNLLWLLVWGIMMVFSMGYSILLIRDGLYRREDRISQMAKIELLTMFILICALYPVIGLGAVVTLIAGSVVWVLMLNQIEWGTWLAPDV